MSKTNEGVRKEMSYRDIEIEGMKEILREKEEHIKKIEKENKELKSKLKKILNTNTWNG